MLFDCRTKSQNDTISGAQQKFHELMAAKIHEVFIGTQTMNDREQNKRTCVWSMNLGEDKDDATGDDVV